MRTKTKQTLPKWLTVLAMVLRALALSLLMALIGLDLYVAQSTFFLRDPMPMPFGYGASVVLSGSMEPALSVDDLIIVHEEESYEVGDMIVFCDGKSTTVHRLVEVDGETLTTRGDANNTNDKPILLNRVKGKVVKTVKGAGKIVSAVRSPLGVLITLAIAVALFEAPYWLKKQKQQEALKAIRAEIEALKNEE